MSILAPILASSIGAICFLFIYWRRLKEDYSANLIFSSGFLFIGAIVFLSFLFSAPSLFIDDILIFRPSQLWFWGYVAGLILGVRQSMVKYKMKLIETLEASILGSLFALSLLFAQQSIIFLDKISLGFSLWLIFLFLLFFFLDKRYKRFSWYKSGKVGFSGLAVCSLYFISRIPISYFYPSSYTIIGTVDVVLSAIAAFLLLFSLYNLSEA